MSSYLLYAEDDDEDVLTLKQLWQAWNQKVDIVRVADGYQLLKFLQEIREQDSFPSLIILDLDLPRLSGTEILKLLRTDDIYRLIPVVVLTIAASGHDISLCKKLGAEVMIKPRTPKEWQRILSHFSSFIDED
jgi:CheY-like chemotaxis protein